MPSLIEQSYLTPCSIPSVEQAVAISRSGRADSELVEELHALLRELEMRFYSLCHMCAAVGDIARAGLQEYAANPYLASIAALTAKEDAQTATIADMFATCLQMLQHVGSGE